MVSAEHDRAVELFKATIPGVDAPVSEWRQLFEDMCGSFALPAGAVIEPVDADGVPCLKVAMPGADPAKLVSSPSQLRNSIVRRGRIPCFASAPRPRVVSIIEAVPLPGSAAPNTHASR